MLCLEWLGDEHMAAASNACLQAVTCAVITLLQCLQTSAASCI